jgi:hypothetical protein
MRGVISGDDVSKLSANDLAPWFETRGVATQLTMRVWHFIQRRRPHPEERACARLEG